MLYGASENFTIRDGTTAMRLLNSLIVFPCHQASMSTEATILQRLIMDRIESDIVLEHVIENTAAWHAETVASKTVASV
jgi:hypothetical protein